MLAGQRRQKIAQRQADVDRLVVPDEMTVCREAARDRRPRKLDFQIAETLVDAFFGVAYRDGAVVHDDLGERPAAIGTWLHRLGKGCDQLRPIRPAVRGEREVDVRLQERHVGDLDAAGEQRKIAQPRRQFRGLERRRRVGSVAEHDIVEDHAGMRKERNGDGAAQRRVQPGDRLDVLLDGVADGIGRDQER